MIINNKKVGYHAKARASYAPEFIDYLYSDVYCVEPNKDMCKTAENNLSHYPNFHSVSGTAEKTTLAMGSVDFITVAQAFHWFDVDGFKAECQRILKHNGKVILVWNSRVSTSELVKENAFICKK